MHGWVHELNHFELLYTSVLWIYFSFFDNHQELTYEEYQQAIADHMEELKENKPFVG